MEGIIGFRNHDWNYIASQKVPLHKHASLFILHKPEQLYKDGITIWLNLIPGMTFNFTSESFYHNWINLILFNVKFIYNLNEKAWTWCKIFVISQLTSASLFYARNGPPYLMALSGVLGYLWRGHGDVAICWVVEVHEMAQCNDFTM